jgi:hypothetical protein
MAPLGNTPCSRAALRELHYYCMQPGPFPSLSVLSVVRGPPSNQPQSAMSDRSVISSASAPPSHARIPAPNCASICSPKPPPGIQAAQSAVPRTSANGRRPRDPKPWRAAPRKQIPRTASPCQLQTPTTEAWGLLPFTGAFYQGPAEVRPNFH